MIAPERLDGRSRAVREPRTCEQCGTEFIPKRQTKGIFCSRACYWAWWGENKGRENSEKGLAKLETLHAEGRDPRATEQATWKRLMAYRDWALTTVAEEDDGADVPYGPSGRGTGRARTIRPPRRRSSTAVRSASPSCSPGTAYA